MKIIIPPGRLKGENKNEKILQILCLGGPFNLPVKWRICKMYRTCCSKTDISKEKNMTFFFFFYSFRPHSHIGGLPRVRPRGNLHDMCETMHPYGHGSHMGGLPRGRPRGKSPNAKITTCTCLRRITARIHRDPAAIRPQSARLLRVSLPQLAVKTHAANRADFQTPMCECSLSVQFFFLKKLRRAPPKSHTRPLRSGRSSEEEPHVKKQKKHSVGFPLKVIPGP